MDLDFGGLCPHNHSVNDDDPTRGVDGRDLDGRDLDWRDLDWVDGRDPDDLGFVA